MSLFQILTATILVLNVFFLIYYDIIARITQTDEKATISWVVLQAAKHFPIIAVATGILVGHLFWPNCGG